MKPKSKYFLTLLALIASAATAISLFPAENLSATETPSRADLIVIDSMKVFGTLERPAVVFQHDTHTQVMEQRGDDCSACHIDYDVPYVFLYNRFDNPNREAVLDIYHDGCIGCHEKDRSENIASGPIECGECHIRTPAVSFSEHIPDFDKSLHQRHITATSSDCSVCHHGYELDAPVKALGYTQGEETSCRDCHLPTDSENRKSYHYVAHRLCINCHLSPLPQEVDPTYQPPSTECVECHNPDHLSKIEKISPIPRLDRGQPDFTFLKSVDESTSDSMNPVVFDHLSHETAADDCRTCHHKSMDRCENCHSLDGKAKGDWIPLAKAMHQGDSEHSCVGCHRKEVKKYECAGCHSLTQTSDTVPSENSCEQCHNIPLSEIQSDKTDLMESLYKTNHPSRPTVDFESLPDVIEIDAISKEYEKVSFPHRSIVEALIEKIEGNNLADYFHQGKNTICASCHHNAPANRSTPPKCISCHGPSRTMNTSDIPDLKSAYHQQCFSCHDTMNIKEPASADCESCHPKN